MDRVETAGDVKSHLEAAARIQRLASLYSLLHEIRTAIVPCTTREALLAAFFGEMGGNRLFHALFIAQSEDGDPALRVTHVQGIPAEHAHEVDRALADPAGFLGDIPQAAGTRRTTRVGLPDPGTESSLAGWLRRQGAADTVLVPLQAEGRLLGVVGLFVGGPGTFDTEHLAVMDHLSTDVSFALERLLAGERREAAESAARASEGRFREVFESSPLPMQLYSSTAHRIVSINPSMRNWLGYTLAEIAREEDWLQRFFPDDATRHGVRLAWQLDLARPPKGEAITSSELTVRAKDGSTRLATGTLTRLGDEAIVAWHDLTEIRRKERASVESGALFRKMIEESSVGIYVRRAAHFIYANPRYCEIIGFPKEEVAGLDIHKVTTTDPGNLRRIHAAWQALEDGAPSVTYRVPLVRKDGVIIELELHARRIDWDGQPADIVIVDDITERKQQEDRIADYLRQLEGSMKSTLQAIANMVELRDPYTAGHEHRTGLIARAIARELGWPEERCATLEMIGLVHDIGKIAVPVEILTKPSRLTPLESQMVREHAQAGYDILKDVPFPTPVATIIWQHHERIDGTGYPNGLQGDQILPEARVLAVADVLESMASHRPYRAALGLEVALGELKKHRGTAFDPEAVDALVRLIEQKGYRIPE